MNVQNLDYIATRELLNKYGVSSVTVAKWITDTIAGKTGLKYEIIGKRCRFFDIAENWFILDKLGTQAVNKRNIIFREEIEPTKEFYNIFSDDEILEITRDLEVRNMINLKFTYRGEGASCWDSFYNENYGGVKYQVPIWTEEMLNHYSKNITEKLQGYDEVNVVDLGCGNGKPIIKFLAKLSKEVTVKRYIAVDISKDLAELSKKNVQEAVPGLEYFAFQKDLEKDKLGEIFSMGVDEDRKVINLVVLLGVMLPNTYDAETILKNIQKTMNLKDILLIDGVKNRPENNLNFSNVNTRDTWIAKKDFWMPKIFGINTDMCEYIPEYDEQNFQKIRYLILDKDYHITFRLKNKHSVKVTLKKKSKLILWFSFRTNPDSYNTILNKTNFNLVDTLSLPNDMHFIISAKPKESRVKNPFQ